MWKILDYWFLLDIATYFRFLKELRTSASVELTNFQDSIHKMDSNVYYARKSLIYQKDFWEPLSKYY